MPGFGAEHREGKAEAQWIKRDPQRANPPESDRGMGASRGRQGGMNGCGKRKQTQARGVGRRVDWRRLLGGRCGRRTGPWSFDPRKVVVIWYKRQRFCDGKWFLIGGW